MSEEKTNFRDVYSIFQDWICSDGILLIEKDEKMVQKLTNDQLLEVYYEFILNPMKILANSRAKKRFSKYDQMQLGIKRKRVVYGKNLNYVPEKHNVYYFRAEKAMLLLMVRSNYKTLKQINPRHVNIFFEVLAREVLFDENTRVDMTHVFHLIQFFIVQAPTESIRNVIKYHIVYELLTHIDTPLAMESLLSLLTPGDNYLKIEDRDRRFLSEYLKMANFGEFLITQLENFKVFDIAIERSRVSRDEQIQKYIASLDSKMVEPSDKSKNFLLTYFHSLFNKAIMNKFHKQPEDIYTRIMDIDSLPKNLFKSSVSATDYLNQSLMHQQKESSNYPGAVNKKFVRSSTLGNLDNLFSTMDNEELSPDAQGELRMIQDTAKLSKKNTLNLDMPSDYDGAMRDQGRKSYRPGPLINATHLSSGRDANKIGKAEKLFHLLKASAKAIMCNNLFLGRPQRKTRIKLQRKAEFVVYPELIPVTHIELKEMSVTKNTTFLDKLKVNEKVNQPISEMIFGMLSSALNQKNFPTFNKLIRLTPGNLILLNQLIFHNNHLLISLLKCFLLRIQFHLDNVFYFHSGYLCGKAFLLLAKNM